MASDTHTSRHIYPIFDRLFSRKEREDFLGQHSAVVWLTGLSGSGKSTIARLTERLLFENGVFCQVLDGDNMRSGINNNLSFSEADRTENIRRIAEVAKLYLDSGVVVICAFISPMRAMRDLARTIIGPDDFIEVYVATPLEVCEERDVKGLYAKARKGELPDFTGVHAPYEEPLNPAIVLQTNNQTPESSAQQLLDLLLPIVKNQSKN